MTMMQPMMQPMMKASGILGVMSMLLLGVAVPAEEAVDVTYGSEHAGDRKPRHTVVPAYPQHALRDRIQGDVEVCFEVNREGDTSRIAVRRSSNKIFEKPAIRAVRESKYVPVPANLALSGIKTCRTFRFRLDPVAVTDSDEDLAGDQP
jgi:TonB family protein